VARTEDDGDIWFQLEKALWRVEPPVISRHGIVGDDKGRSGVGSDEKVFRTSALSVAAVTV